MQSEDFHFYNDWKTALDNGDALVLTGFKVLPRAGGWMEQDFFEKQDLKTYLRLYRWAWRMNHPKDGNDKQPDDLFNFERDCANTEIDDFVN